MTRRIESVVLIDLQCPILDTEEELLNLPRG